MRAAHRVTTALVTVTVALAGCGGPDSSGSGGDGKDKGFPVTVTDARGKVDIDATPERIVSLSPSSTEMLFTVGAGDQVAAADEFSNYPKEAPTTDLSGFQPNVEAITEKDPDLVILARDAKSAEKTSEQLEKVKIPVLMVPPAESLDDTYDQMRMLGKATGHAGRADKEADRVESEIDGTVADTKKRLKDADASDLTYYYELDDQLHSVTSETFIGQIYERFGLTNIADKAKDTSGGYPKLSREFVVEQDPDLVFLSYGSDKDAAALRKRPAFDTVTAVEDDHVTSLDPDVASRWGPRVVDLVEDVSSAVVAAEGK